LTKRSSDGTDQQQRFLNKKKKKKTKILTDFRPSFQVCSADRGIW